MTECLIWTPGGCWFQHVEDGVQRNSFLGPMALWNVENFCRERSLRLHVYDGQGRMKASYVPESPKHNPCHV